VWILVVLLIFVAVGAFYLLWLKAGGTEDAHQVSGGRASSPWNTYAAKDKQG
jgi:hypothetical protein